MKAGATALAARTPASPSAGLPCGGARWRPGPPTPTQGLLHADLATVAKVLPLRAPRWDVGVSWVVPTKRTWGRREQTGWRGRGPCSSRASPREPHPAAEGTRGVTRATQGRERSSSVECSRGAEPSAPRRDSPRLPVRLHLSPRRWLVLQAPLHSAPRQAPGPPPPWPPLHGATGTPQAQRPARRQALLPRPS